MTETDGAPVATRITMDNVLPLLRAAVETRGDDYRYKDHHDLCQYAIADRPACLIGVMLAATGRDVARLDLATEGAEGSTEIGDLCAAGAVDADPSAARVLAEAQEAQDTGLTWGDAYNAAFVKHASLA